MWLRKIWHYRLLSRLAGKIAKLKNLLSCFSLLWQTFHTTLVPGGNDLVSAKTAEWNKRSIAELKSELIKLGLHTTGKKGTLIERLQQHLLAKQMQASQDGDEQAGHLSDRRSPNLTAASTFAQPHASSKTASSLDGLGENAAVFKNFLPNQARNSSHSGVPTLSAEQLANPNLLLAGGKMMQTLQRQLLETNRQLQELGQRKDADGAGRKLSSGPAVKVERSAEQDTPHEMSLHRTVKTAGEFTAASLTQGNAALDTHQLLAPSQPQDVVGSLLSPMSRLKPTSVPNSPLGSPHSSYPSLHEHGRPRQHSVPHIFPDSQLHQRHLSYPGELSPNAMPGLQLPERSADGSHKRLLRSSTCTAMLSTMDENASPALVSTTSLPAIPHVPSYFNPRAPSPVNTPPLSRHVLPPSQGMGRSVSLNTEFSTVSHPVFIHPQRSASSSGLDSIPAENLTLPADLTMVSKVENQARVVFNQLRSLFVVLFCR